MSPKTFVTVDLETTGVDLQNDSIIEVGLVRCTTTEILETYQTLVRPSTVVSDMTTLLTEISSEELADAPHWHTVQQSIQDFIGDVPVIGHSVGFDTGFLRKAGIHLSATQYDTYDFAQILSHGTPSYKLAYLADAAGIERGQHHRALDDAVMTAKLFQWYVRKLQELPDAVQQDLVFLLHLWQKTPNFLRDFLPPCSSENLSREPYFFMRDFPEKIPPIQQHSKPSPTHDDLLSVLSDVATDQFSAIASVVPPGSARFSVIERLEVASADTLVQLLLQRENQDKPIVVTVHTSLRKKAYQACIASLNALLQNKHVRLASYRSLQSFFCPLRFEQVVRNPQDNQALLLFCAKMLVWLASTKTYQRRELRLRYDMAPYWEASCVDADIFRHATAEERLRSPYHHYQLAVRDADILLADHRELLQGGSSEASVVLIDEAERWIQTYTEMLTEKCTSVAWEHLGKELLGLVSPSKDPEAMSQLALLEVEAKKELYIGTFSMVLTAIQRRKDLLPPDTKLLVEQFQKACFAGWQLGNDLFREIDSCVQLSLPAQEDSKKSTKIILTTHELHTPIWQRLSLGLGALPSAIAVLQERWNALVSLYDSITDPFVRGVFGSCLVQGKKLTQTLSFLLESCTEHPTHICWIDARQGSWTIVKAPMDCSTWDVVTETTTPVLFQGSALTVNATVQLFCQSVGLPVKLLYQDTQPLPLHIASQTDEPLLGHILPQLSDRKNSVLLLVPSTFALEELYTSLFPDLQKLGIPRIVLGITHNSAQLQQAIQADTSGLYMLTTDSILNIQTIPGLVQTYIMKIPFLYPGDPLHQERGKQYDHEFDAYTLPQTILRLKAVVRRTATLSPPFEKVNIVLWDDRMRTMGYADRIRTLLK